MAVKINLSSILKSIFSAAAILFYSCEYSPSETTYHDIKIEEPQIEFTILDEESLTALRGYVNLAYQPDLNGHQLYGFKVFIGEVQVAQSSLSFDTQDFSDGEYKLRLELHVSTNSGSLADRAGAEYYIINKEFDIYIFNAPIETPQITDIVIENTLIKVKWEKYNQKGFEKYILHRDGKIIAEITDVNQTEAADYSYTGGTSYYTLQLNAFGSGFSGNSEPYTAPASSLVSSEVIDHFNIKLIWEKNQFDSSFSYYEIKSWYDLNKILVKIYDINQTSWIDENPAFGGQNAYFLQVIPKMGEPSDNRSQISTPSAIGKYFDYHTESYFEYIPSKNFFIIYYSNEITKYDASTITVLDSIQINGGYNEGYKNIVDVSSDGELFYHISKSYEDFQINKLNIFSLQTEKTIYLNNILPKSTTYLKAISIADNNRMAVITENNYTSFALNIIDLNTETLAASISVSAPDFSRTLAITENGEYISWGRDMYKFDQNTIIHVGSIDTNPENAVHPIFLSNNQIVYYKGDKLQIVNAADLSISKEVAVETLGTGSVIDFMIDRTTGYIGFQRAPKYFIYDINSGMLKKEIYVMGADFAFQNGIFFGNSRYMPITLN